MNAAHPHEGACPSRLRFDQLIAGELERAQAEQLEQHAASCARCRPLLAAQQRGHARFSAQLPPAVRARVAERGGEVGRERSARSRARVWLRWSTPLLAAAAALLAYRTWSGAPAEDAVRTKGSALRFYVLHDGVVRPGSDGERVQPGDRLQFTYTNDQDAYLLIVSIDGAGKASAYYSDGERAASVAAGSGVPLARSTLLDDTLGRETVYALQCAEPIAIAPVLEALQRAPTREPAAPGCTVERYALLKVPR